MHKSSKDRKHEFDDSCFRALYYCRIIFARSGAKTALKPPKGGGFLCATTGKVQQCVRSFILLGKASQ